MSCNNQCGSYVYYSPCGSCNPYSGKNQSNSSTSTKVSKYKAEWTGKYPYQYLGEWKLYRNNTDVSYLVPTCRRYCPAYTFGEYPVWEECPYAYVQQFAKDGLEIPEWIQANLYWLILVGDTGEDFKNIYLAFHEFDFRTSRWM